jgi:penicillin amidase
MRWVGQLACDWPSAQLRLNRAANVDAAFTAVRGWLSPTFSLLVADDEGPNGHIAFTNTGTIPVRGRPERGYRDATNPDDAWLGLIPPEGMPQTRDPSVGWLGSANNRPAPDDFPYPLSGTWDEGLRHRRIGQLAERLTPHDAGTMARMHADVRVGRADDLRPAIGAALSGRLDGIDKDALDILLAWGGRATADSTGAVIWEVFWTRWVQAVAAIRFPPQSADFVAGWMNGFAGRMLTADQVGWFASDEARLRALVGAFREAVAELRMALGDRPHQWQWGALHHKGMHHPLSTVGDLGALLDQPVRPSGGDVAVLNNAGFAGGRIPADDPRYARNWEGASGAGYRLVADLGDPNGSAWTVTLEGQSANPGSPNRSDQIEEFLAGHHHEVPLDRKRAAAAAVHRLTIEPRGRHD